MVFFHFHFSWKWKKTTKQKNPWFWCLQDFNYIRSEKLHFWGWLCHDYPKKGSELYLILSKVGSKSLQSELQGKPAIPWHSRQIGKSPAEAAHSGESPGEPGFLLWQTKGPEEAAVPATSNSCLCPLPSSPRALSASRTFLPSQSKGNRTPARSHPPFLSRTSLALLPGTVVIKAEEQRRRAAKPYGLCWFLAGGCQMWPAVSLPSAQGLGAQWSWMLF